MRRAQTLRKGDVVIRTQHKQTRPVHVTSQPRVSGGQVFFMAAIPPEGSPGWNYVAARWPADELVSDHLPETARLDDLADAADTYTG